MSDDGLNEASHTDQHELHCGLDELRSKRQLLGGKGSRKARLKVNQQIRALELRLGGLAEREGTSRTGASESLAPAAYGSLCFPGNFVPSSEPGCHVAHGEAPWIVGSAPFEREALGLEENDPVPDMSIDPDTRMLSVINTDEATPKSFFITTSHRALDKTGRALGTGPFRDEEGKVSQVVTLVLVVLPAHVMDVCYLDITPGQATGEEALDLYSDIKDAPEHPHPGSDKWEPARTYPFPLGGKGPYLCSQGVGGRFTHFYPGTYHALDLACPPGTDVKALAGGVVQETRQEERAGGIHAKGLFGWNSVSVLHDDDLLAEYVHVKADSVTVKPGERVTAGQKLCESGDVGFCPRPHLHVQVQRGVDRGAATVMFMLQDAHGCPYLPRAGGWYGPDFVAGQETS